LTAAEALPQTKFLLGGSGWSGKPLPANVINLGHVYTGDHNAFNSSLKAILNISRDSMARYGFCPATRVFEAAGAAACIITDAWAGIELFLKPGTEILTAQSGRDVVEILKNLTLEEARSIGQKARQRILREHTYSRRAEQVESLLNA